MYGSPNTRPLFAIAGIPVSISVMHLVLLLLIAFPYLQSGLAVGVGVMVMTSFSVLFHEMGHGLVSRHFGLNPRIQLVLLGGGCAHDPARRPRDLFLLVAAGPGATFLLAALSFVGLQFASGALQTILQFSFSWNVAIGIFNLLPMLPFDGGILTQILFEKIWPRGGVGERRSYTLGLIVALIGVALGLTYRGPWMFIIIYIMGSAALDNWRALKAVRTAPERHETVRHSEVRELLQAARASFARGDFEDAIRLCHQARAEPFLSIDEMRHIWQVLALSAARLSRWEDAARYAERVQGSAEMAQVQAVCILALKDAQRAKVFLASRSAQLIERGQLESIRVLARSTAGA